LAVGVELVEEAFGAVGFADAHQRLNLQAVRDDECIVGINAKGEGILASPTGTVLQVRRNEIECPETAAGGVRETAGTEGHGEAGNSLQRIGRFCDRGGDRGHIDRSAGADLRAGIAAVKNATNAPALGTKAVEHETTIGPRGSGGGDSYGLRSAGRVDLQALVTRGATAEEHEHGGEGEQNRVHSLVCAGT